MKWWLVIMIWTVPLVEESDAISLTWVKFESYEACLVAADKVKQSHHGDGGFSVTCVPYR